MLVNGPPCRAGRAATIAAYLHGLAKARLSRPKCLDTFELATILLIAENASGAVPHTNKQAGGSHEQHVPVGRRRLDRRRDVV